MHTHLSLASGLVFWRFFFFLDGPSNSYAHVRNYNFD
jgi:hypothetical protein